MIETRLTIPVPEDIRTLHERDLLVLSQKIDQLLGQYPMGRPNKGGTLLFDAQRNIGLDCFASKDADPALKITDYSSDTHGVGEEYSFWQYYYDINDSVGSLFVGIHTDEGTLQDAREAFESSQRDERPEFIPTTQYGFSQATGIQKFIEIPLAPNPDGSEDRDGSIRLPTLIESEAEYEMIGFQLVKFIGFLESNPPPK